MAGKDVDVQQLGSWSVATATVAVRTVTYTLVGIVAMNVFRYTGAFGALAPASASIEGRIYLGLSPTRALRRGLVEIMTQSSPVWVQTSSWLTHPAVGWIPWVFGSPFVLSPLLPAPGLLAPRTAVREPGPHRRTPRPRHYLPA